MINISSSSDINLNEVSETMTEISGLIPDDAQIVFGCTIDKNKINEIEVSIIIGS